jgi:N-acetylglucosaminyl-diphospho-decaprenol L-rhamnosyltransferase
MRVAAIVVTHNSAQAVTDCLPLLKGPDEIVVVDNASLDHTVEAVRHVAPEALLIRNKCNVGFGAAVNQGVRDSSAELIVLINPDAAPMSQMDSDCAMARRASETKIGVVGGKLVGMDGNVQSGFAVRGFPTLATLSFESLGINRIWPSNPINRRYRMAGFDYDKSQPCDQPAGAFMMFRRSVFDELGGFDEGFYPIWFEDVDFCLRASSKGYSNWYEPDCEAVHRGAHSISSLSLPQRHKYWYGSLLRFAKKHYGPLSAAYLRAVVVVGLALRGVASGWGANRRPARRAYFKTMRMALAGTIGGRDSNHGVNNADRPRAA